MNAKASAEGRCTGKLCVTLQTLEHRKGKVSFWKGEFGCIMSGLSLYRVAGFVGQ